MLCQFADRHRHEQARGQCQRRRKRQQPSGVSRSSGYGEGETAAAGAIWVTDWKRTSRSPIASFARVGSWAATEAIATSLARCA